MYPGWLLLFFLEPGYRQNHSISGENTVAGGNRRGKNARERYNEIITVKKSEEPRRRRDGKNDESNSHYNENKSIARDSRRDKHEKKRAEENMEKVEEKRLGGEAVSMDKHEEKKARITALKSVEEEPERYSPDLDVDAVPEKMAPADFRSEVNTINVSGVHDKKAMSNTQLEDKNEDNVNPVKSEVQDNDVRKKLRDADEDKVSPVKSEVQDNDVRKKQRDADEDKVSPVKSEVQDNDVRKKQRDADEDKVSPVKSEVQDNDVRKKQRDADEDKVSPVKSEEERSRRYRSEKEINSGKDEEQTIEDNKGQIMEIISRNIGNENMERKKGEPSNKPTKEFEDANKSQVFKEGRLQAKNDDEILSYQESPIFSKQEESGVADTFEEEQKETRDKSNTKLNCTSTNQELKKLVKDEAYKDQARMESLEAAQVPCNDPTLEIKSKEGDLSKQNTKAVDKLSESYVSAVDVIQLSNETLSMTAGPVPVQALEASPTIKRRKSVTFDTNINKIHLYAPDIEEYSYYQV
ncbi:hypothetical protein ACJMK2_040017 [Sinanodonta woodiana]|uniref:Uncharacterized protein n=1 Tax=Sinanodonta woodiana TaxID=1069815 RepID=A0ABD3WDQ5_SINWO